MSANALATTLLADVLKPKSEGNVVNVHIVEVAQEPLPNFDNMLKIINNKNLVLGGAVDDGRDSGKFSSI